VPASEVTSGDRIRIGGDELQVSRIESPFLGRDGLVAFIEDTPQRWLKRPVPVDAEVDVMERG
jgi:hypothetical protein